VRTFLTSLSGQRLHAVMLLSLPGLRPAEHAGCAGRMWTLSRARSMW
jgi:hypothetical protein